MKWKLLALMLAGLVTLAPPLGALEKVDTELVLAADGSGSIDADELKLQREGYANAITHPRFLQAIEGGFHQAIALAFMEWGGPESQHTIVDWMKIDGPASAKAFAYKLRAAPRAAFSYKSISEALLSPITRANCARLPPVIHRQVPVTEEARPPLRPATMPRRSSMRCTALTSWSGASV